MEEQPRRALVELTPEAAERLRDPRVLLGVVFVIAGAVAVAIGYWGVSGTLDPGKQLPYIISGGIGGVFLLGTGAAVLFSSELADARAQNRETQRLVRELGDEVRSLRETLDAAGTAAPARTRNGRARTAAKATGDQ
ncbi:MAG: hypothetical protein QOJ67_3739 [Acidimicrobiaceae bacterium]